MKELIYQVEFLSDIVLPATSNTEGNITQLDFIPGSNFLGMVASNYSKFEDSFKIFHSSHIRFGDATILNDGQPTYKMPFSYFHEKLDENVIYNHHKIEDFTKFNQLKQKRNGYITSDKKVVYIDYTYSQKSGYDKEKRRSKDSSMYGYSAINSGTKWQFRIKYDEDISSNDLKLIKETIVGKKRLGKSKSSQYGLVEIKEQGRQENLEALVQDEIVLYANSRLALYDEAGNATYDLRYLVDGLKDENILYDKCQLRTSTFTPYNGARVTKDYERVCINKGSVIVLKDISQKQLKSIKDGVGVYLSEGFGEILINPTFLSEVSFTFKVKEKTEDKAKYKTEKISPISNISKFLQQREDAKRAKLDLANEVAMFIKDNKPIYPDKMNSQWGSIRSLCSKHSDKTIDEEVKKYISHGVAATKWEGNKTTTLLRAIKQSKNPLDFTKLLSTQMPKVKEQKND